MGSLGFDGWFAEQVEQAGPDLEAVRVIAVHRSSFIVSDGVSDIRAEAAGKLLHNSDSPLDIPTVGDWVLVQVLNDRTLAIIHRLLKRKSLLARKTPGRKVDFQLIGANIDTALIMQALDEDFNPRRLERYLVMAREGSIKPVIILSKSDLLSSGEVANRVRVAADVARESAVLAFSNQDKTGFDEVKDLFQAAMTYCLLGSSGVGKTTLLNNFLDEERFEIRSVRVKDGKGRHTTTSRQLIMLDNGAMVIDTPGMRELGSIAIKSGLAETFDEITLLAARCRFNDCTHMREQGCAVLEALGEGTLSRERYDNYMKMRHESEYHEMSYLDRRKKDQAFGRMVRSVMKEKRKRDEGR